MCIVKVSVVWKKIGVKFETKTWMWKGHKQALTCRERERKEKDTVIVTVNISTFT